MESWLGLPDGGVKSYLPNSILRLDRGRIIFVTVDVTELMSLGMKISSWVPLLIAVVPIFEV